MFDKITSQFFRKTLILLLLTNFLLNSQIFASQEDSCVSDFLNEVRDTSRLEKLESEKNGGKPLATPIQLQKEEIIKIRWEEMEKSFKNDTPKAEKMLSQLIEEAREISNIIKSSDGKEPSLARLIKAFYKSQDTEENLTILFMIQNALISEKCAIDDLDTLYDFTIRRRSVKFFASNAFSLDPKKLERLGMLIRLKNASSKEQKEIMKQIQDKLDKEPLNPSVLVWGAKAYSLVSNQGKAKELLAIAYFIEGANVYWEVRDDPEFASLASQTTFMKDLWDRNLIASFVPIPFFGIKKLDITYSWSGYGNPINEARTIMWEDNNEFFCYSNGTKVPPWIIFQIFKNIEPASQSNCLVNQITHTGDYPNVYLEITGSETYHLFSNSNTPLMLPFNAFFKGKLYTVNSEALGQAVCLLLKWLDIRRGFCDTVVSAQNEVIRTRQNQSGELAQEFQQALQKSSFPYLNNSSSTKILPQKLSLPSGWTQNESPIESFIPNTPFSIFKHSFDFPGEKAIPSKKFRLKYICGSQENYWLGFTPERLFAVFSSLENTLSAIHDFHPFQGEFEKESSTRLKEMEQLDIWRTGNALPYRNGMVTILKEMISPLIFFQTDFYMQPWGKPYFELPPKLIGKSGYTLNDLGQESLPIEVKVAFGEKKGAMTGYYLLGAQSLIIKEFALSVQPLTPFIRILLDYCGFGQKVPSSLEYISLGYSLEPTSLGNSNYNYSLSLIFKNSAEDQELDEALQIMLKKGLIGSKIDEESKFAEDQESDEALQIFFNNDLIGRKIYDKSEKEKINEILQTMSEGLPGKKRKVISFKMEKPIYFILDKDKNIRISQ